MGTQSVGDIQLQTHLRFGQEDLFRHLSSDLYSSAFLPLVCGDHHGRKSPEAYGICIPHQQVVRLSKKHKRGALSHPGRSHRSKPLGDTAMVIACLDREQYIRELAGDELRSFIARNQAMVLPS